MKTALYQKEFKKTLNQRKLLHTSQSKTEGQSRVNRERVQSRETAAPFIITTSVP